MAKLANPQSFNSFVDSVGAMCWRVMTEVRSCAAMLSDV